MTAVSAPATTITTPRVLHVTESMAAGVMFAVRSYATEQASSGAEVAILHMRRPDSPTPTELRALFPAEISMHEFHGKGRVRELITMAREVTRLTRADPTLRVHVHSSFAGAVVRVAALAGRFSKRTFYSPHGFAFLREDLSTAKRRMIAMTERLLAAGCVSVVVLSESELVECTRVGITNAVIVENGVDLSALPVPAESRTVSERLAVMTAARITAQKAPGQFALAASGAAQFADFTWIGGSPDGIESDVEQLRRAGVTVTGWLGRQDVLDQLARCDVYLSLSLWEGMPLALLEAQCLGIPAVVLDTVGNRDVVVDGVTGFVVGSTEEAIGALQLLRHDRELYGSMSRNALAARDRFDQRKLGPRYLELYSTNR